MRDGLLIDSRLLLDYGKLARETYVSVGVPEKKIEQKNFLRWLPTYIGQYAEAFQLQVARDARFAEALFLPGTREFAMLDVAYAFADAEHLVHVYSFETSDALEAIVARAGIKAVQHPMVDESQIEELIVQVHQEWLLVVTLGLTPLSVSVIEKMMGDRGIIINLKSPHRAADTADQLIKILEERWNNDL